MFNAERHGAKVTVFLIECSLEGIRVIFSKISVFSQNLTTFVNYSVIFHLHLEFLFVFSPINGLFSDHVLNMSLVADSLRTADAFPVRRERSDDRKCVCCSQARWLNSAPRLSSVLLSPKIEYHFPWFLKVHYSPGSMACGMYMFSQWLSCMRLLLLPQPQVTHF